MPRSQRQRTDGMNGDYPPNWKEIAQRVKERAGWRCERCGHPHDIAAGYMLTVHHLNMQKDCIEDWNLAALCQRCHLRIQGKVDFYQQYMLPHSAWMQPHVEAFKLAMGITRLEGLVEGAVPHDDHQYQ